MIDQLCRCSRIAIFAAVLMMSAGPALAADGQVLITHAKALDGNVTPGDDKGYPVTLSISGSYILGSDLAPGFKLDAIDATTSDISIDLNGFKISGGPSGGTNNASIGIWGRGDRLTVRNGTITGFTSAAIDAAGRSYLTVEDMRLIHGGKGINSYIGFFAYIRNNVVAANQLGGIYCGYFCHVEGNIASFNGLYGVYIRSGMILGNTIASNTFQGIYVFDANSIIGYGNNTLFGNNSGGQQVNRKMLALHPNACVPACP